MSNNVYLNPEDIIVIEVVGDQNVASIELMGRRTDTLLTQLKAMGKPGLILDNLLQIGKVDADGRKYVVELSKRLDYDRLAMVGKGGLMRFGTNLMLRATGKSYKVRYFDNMQEATAWLKAPHTNTR